MAQMLYVKEEVNATLCGEHMTVAKEVCGS